MSKATCEVINNALKAHDQDSAYWLARVKALINDPDNALHRKALEVTKDYLETFSRSPGQGTLPKQPVKAHPATHAPPGPGSRQKFSCRPCLRHSPPP